MFKLPTSNVIESSDPTCIYNLSIYIIIIYYNHYVDAINDPSPPPRGDFNAFISTCIISLLVLIAINSGIFLLLNVEVFVHVCMTMIYLINTCSLWYKQINYIEYINNCTSYLYRANTYTSTIRVPTIVHAVYKHISVINSATCTTYYTTNNNFQFRSLCGTHYIYIIISYFIITYIHLYSLHIPECGIHDVMNNLMCQFDILSKSTQIIILYLVYIIYLFHCLTCKCMLIAISEIKLIACRNMYYRQGYQALSHDSCLTNNYTNYDSAKFKTLFS